MINILGNRFNEPKRFGIKGDDRGHILTFHEYVTDGTPPFRSDTYSIHSVGRDTDVVRRVGTPNTSPLTEDVVGVCKIVQSSPK